MAKKEKKPVGRPARPMPERIDASPEEIADRVLRMPRRRTGATWRRGASRRSHEHH